MYGKPNPSDMPYNHKVRILKLLRLLGSVPSKTLKDATNKHYRKYVSDLRSDHGMAIVSGVREGERTYTLVIDNTAAKIVQCKSGSQRIQNIVNGERRYADGRIHGNREYSSDFAKEMEVREGGFDAWSILSKAVAIIAVGLCAASFLHII